jgi:hypothetical protein
MSPYYTIRVMSEDIRPLYVATGYHTVASSVFIVAKQRICTNEYSKSEGSCIDIH